MENYIRNIQDTVMKYAEILSEVLKVDVEILDNQFSRIAGTGKFKNYINCDMSREAHIYKRVIDSGEKNVNWNPGEQEICEGCPHVNNCEEKFGMSTPIIMNSKVIGVIGFVCFTDQQRTHIVDNLQTYSNFSDQIAELISLKAKEEIEKKSMIEIMELLMRTIDKMEEGVIIVDENDEVFRVNHLAKIIMDIDINQAMPKVVFEPVDNYIFNKREFCVTINDELYSLYGDVYQIYLSNVHSYKVFIFNDLNTMKERYMNATNVNENVGLDKIIGKSERIAQLKEKLKIIASSTSTVLITGESGTGKELVSRAIHMEGSRSSYPFVAINCASIPDTLLESELFGYEKGAFTGADPKGKIGKFELAQNGTLFLDEIGDMPIYLQAKLLRVLQDHKIVRLGSNREIDVDVRIIAATNKDLEEMIRGKTFREDLLYRLNVIPVQVPTLRERKEDIPMLAEYFINKYVNLFDKHIAYIDPRIMENLGSYDWPGNVRELENVMEYMVSMVTDSVINVSMLPSKIVNSAASGNNFEFNLELNEMRTIKRAVAFYGEDLESKKNAAKELGIGIATLYRKIDKYKL